MALDLSFLDTQKYVDRRMSYRDRALLANYFKGRNRMLVLDAGCGSSRSTIGLAVDGNEVVSLDVIPEALALSRLVYDKLGCRDGGNFVRGDVRHLPFRNGSFDVVFSGGVLEHFEKEGFETLVREHLRVIKMGGHFIFSVPNPFSLFAVKGVIAPFLGRGRPRSSIENYFAFKELVAVLQRCQMKVREVQPIVIDAMLPHWLVPFNGYIRMLKNLSKVFPSLSLGFDFFLFITQRA